MVGETVLMSVPGETMYTSAVARLGDKLMRRNFALPEVGAELSSVSTSDCGLDEKLKGRIVVSVPGSGCFDLNLV
jgi:hypothetical protein